MQGIYGYNKKCLIIGGLLALITTYLFVSRVLFIEASNYAIGEVINIKEHIDSDGDSSYFPVIEFSTLNLREITFKSSTSDSSLVIGDSVGVLYSPQKPSEAMINSFSSIWGLPIFLCIPSLMLIATGLGYVQMSDD